MARETFWRMPPRWVWLLFLGSMTIFTASMVTWLESFRFISRPLAPGERLIVARALDTWHRLDPGEEVESLRALLASGNLRAMDEASFRRKQERITLGYTDERGRILLNPDICFSSYRTLGQLSGGGVHDTDLVRTMTTLHHEYQHLRHNACESDAYEAEWRFVRRCLTRCTDPALTRELEYWEGDMQERVRLYVGTTRFDQLKEKL